MGPESLGRVSKAVVDKGKRNLFFLNKTMLLNARQSVVTPPDVMSFYRAPIQRWSYTYR